MNARVTNLSLLRRRIVTDGLWVLLGQGFAALGMLVGIRILTGLVEPDVYGAVTLLLGVSALLLGLLCTPLIQAALRFYPEHSASNTVGALRCAISAKLRKTVGAGVGLLLLAGGLHIVGWDGSWIALALLIALLIVDVLRALETSLLNAARRHKPYAYWAVGEAWTRPMVAVAFVMIAGSATESVLAGYALASLALLVVMRISVQREGPSCQGNVQGDQKNLSRAIDRYALPLMPLALAGWLSSLADRYIIGGTLGLAEAGIYAATYGLVSRPFLMLGQIIELTLRPVYQEAVSASDRARADRIFKGWLLLLVPAVTLGFLAILLWHKQIADLLLGEQFRSGARLMPWIAAGYAILVVSYVYERACYAYGATRQVLIIQLTGTVACLMLVTVAVLNWGLLGAAMAVPAYFSIQLIAALIAGTWARESARIVKQETNQG